LAHVSRKRRVRHVAFCWSGNRTTPRG
jgi:hypothetical protein